MIDLVDPSHCLHSETNQHMSHVVVQATPANWPYNHDSIGKKGWAFLLPTVTPEDAKTHFPDHHSCKVCCHSVINLCRCGHASCQDCNSYLVEGALQGCIHLRCKHNICLLCCHTVDVVLVINRHDFAMALYFQSACQ